MLVAGAGARRACATEASRAVRHGGALLEAGLARVGGGSGRLADIPARVLAVNFWATWCKPCRFEIPELVEVHRTWRPRGASVVGIAIDDADRLPDFLRIFRVDYPMFVAPERGPALMRDLGNVGGALPFTVVLRQSGEVLAERHGIVDRARLETWLREALQ
jgi:thiol-disulfide isomerase/thioredoxin